MLIGEVLRDEVHTLIVSEVQLTLGMSLNVSHGGYTASGNDMEISLDGLVEEGEVDIRIETLHPVLTFASKHDGLKKDMSGNLLDEDVATDKILGGGHGHDTHLL
jgi:hypothetical protein